MANGIYFYWVSWLVWILFSFFHVEHYNRYFVMCWLFLLMITFSYDVNIIGYELSIAFFLLLIGSIILYVQTELTARNLFVTFTIMTAYLTLRTWEIMAPIWFFMPSIIMIPLIMSMGTFILLKGVKHQIAQMLLGISFGELFYSLILSSYYLNNKLVPTLFFDYLAIIVLIIICLHILRIIWMNTIQIVILLFNKNSPYKN